MSRRRRQEGHDGMRLDGKKITEIMDRDGITAEWIADKTGLCAGSVRWILNNGFSSEEAVGRIAEAVGLKIGEILLPEISSNMENTIEFTRDSKQATVTFTQGRYKTKIRKLSEQRPEECRIISENTDGSMCAHIPVTWIKINPTLELTEEERQERAERLRRK